MSTKKRPKFAEMLAERMSDLTASGRPLKNYIEVKDILE
jgi:hypothetical protein